MRLRVRLPDMRCSSSSNDGRAQQLGVQRHGRERRVEHAREVHVVEADDRELVRDPDAALARGQVHAGGDHVVVAEDRGGLLVEELQPR